MFAQLLPTLPLPRHLWKKPLPQRGALGQSPPVSADIPFKADGMATAVEATSKTAFDQAWKSSSLITLSKVVALRNVRHQPFESKASSRLVHLAAELQHQVCVQALRLVCLHCCSPASCSPLLQGLPHPCHETMPLLQASHATISQQHHFSMHSVILAVSLCLGRSPALARRLLKHQFNMVGGPARIVWLHVSIPSESEAVLEKKR